MWINLKHETLTSMEDSGEAVVIARFGDLNGAEKFYRGQEGTYSGYIHPNPPNAYATPVVVLKIGMEEGEEE